MRFVLDEDVDARLVGLLVSHGHDAWTASDAGMSSDADDELSVYADEHNAVLITHDKEFSRRRRANPIGRHVRLQCREPEAMALVEGKLDQIIAAIEPFDDICVIVSLRDLETYQRWT